MLSLFPDTLDTGDLEFVRLCDVESVVVAGRDHPLATAGQLNRQQLAQCNWVIADQIHATHSFRDFLSRCTIPPQAHHVRANSLRLIKSLVIDSDYLSILPTMLIQKELASGRVTRLNGAVRSLVSLGGLAWRKTGFQSAALREFVDIVRQEMVAGAAASAAASATPDKASCPIERSKMLGAEL